MSTLYAKVQEYTGGTPPTASVSDWLTAGARQVIDLLPKDKLLRSSSTQSFTTSLSITLKRILNLLVAGYPPREIDYKLSARASDPTSINYASSTDPVFWVSGGTIYVAPITSTAILEYIAYPTVSYSDTQIAGYPQELEQLVILYTAIQVLIKQGIDSTTALMAISVPTFSGTLSDPTFTYTDASLGTYTPTTIGSFSDVPTDTLTAILGSSSTSGTPFYELATAFSNFDIELANTKMNEIQSRISQWKEDYLGINIPKYQASVQKVIEQARISQEQLLKLASDTTNLNLANDAKQLESQVAQYSAKLSKYKSELDYYSGQIGLFGGKVQQYQTAFAQIVKTIEILRNEYALLLGLGKQ